MISLALVAMIAAAAPSDGMAQPRKNYEQCLSELHDSELEAKAELAAFESAMGTTCARQEAMLKAAITAHYVGMKTPKKEAEQSAVDWVTDLKQSATDRYRSTVEAQPAPK